MIEFSPRHARHAVKLIMAGLFMIYYGLSRVKEKRKNLDVPLSKIKSISSGKVKLLGKSQTFYPHQSPISDINCCLSVLVVEQLRINSWVPMSKIFNCQGWYLEGVEGNKIYLNPQIASFDGKAQTIKTIYPWSSDQKIEKIVKEAGFNSKWILGQKLFRVNEYVIEPGEEIEVIGETGSYDLQYQSEGFSKLQITDGPMSSFNVKIKDQPLKKEWTTALLFAGGGTFLTAGIGLLAGLIESGFSPVQMMLALLAGFITLFSLMYYLGEFHIK